MAKWEDLNWAFDSPDNDSFFMTSSPPPTNRFKLKPSVVPPELPHIYELVTVNSNDVAPFWSGLKLLPQGGAPLKTKSFTQALTSVTNSPSDFERLVGFVSMNGEDNPVTFYKAESGSKSLLVVRVNMVGASPGGVVQGTGNP